MKKKLVVLLFFTLSAKLLSAQDLTEFLQTVASGHPELAAAEKLLELRRIEARTGNTPSDPFISGALMPGNTDEAGTKKIWSITQSFSFPTKYLLQKSVNRNTVKLAEQEYELGKLSILLEARLNALDIIFYRKSLRVLLSRKEGFDRLRDAWKKMLDNGAATIIEYNRIVMELSDLELQIAQKESEIRMKQEMLMFMSGSAAPPDFNEYPAAPMIDREQILNEKKLVHPSWLLPAMEYELKLQQLKLSRTGSLPEFEIGIESESVPGEIYTGPVAGISIPLWSNANRIKAASVAADHAMAVNDAEISRLTATYRNEYSRVEALSANLSTLREIIATSGGTRYTDAALAAGEITVASYFSSMEALYRTENRFLELENEYNKSLSVILDHRMLK